MKIVFFIISSLLFAACSNNDNTANTQSLNEEKQENSSTPSHDNIEDGKTIPAKELSASEENKEIPPSRKVADIEKKGEKVVEIVETELTDIEEEYEIEAPPAPMVKVDFSNVYNQILNNFVTSSGKVNYAAIKTNREMLGQATLHFEENPPQNSWSKNQKLAYWINAYNLYTIQLVVENYPVKSIKDINGGKPWDKKFIKLAGKTLSLNDIENGIIRKDFNEPRIHFAVNCASISCPKLLNKAYTSGNLNSLLESQTLRFVNDNAMNTIANNSIQISSIFDWYKVDFGDVITFLNKYSTVEISPSAKISYGAYNWNLNN